MKIKNRHINKLTFYGIMIILASATIQFLLISYKHFIGYVIINSTNHFLIMFFRGTILSSLMIAIVVFIDLKIIKVIQKQLSWKDYFSIRLLIELVVSFILGALIGLSFTLINMLIFGYKQPLGEVIISNLLIATVINLIILAVLEAIIYFKSNQKSQLKAEILERENVNMRFNMLKQQLDPHFLFNSLNILSSLIPKDKKKSQQFVDVFSSVYRYTLDVVDKLVVSVEEELNFMQDYLFLQNLRFEDAFIYELEIDEPCLKQFLPPLALQVLIENAFKHNIASKDKPLRIHISARAGDNMLNVVNNIQQKGKFYHKPGIGLENLKNRYLHISDRIPEIQTTENEFKVTLPLIEAE